MKATVEVGDIFRQYGANFRQQYKLSGAQLKAMHAIERCRTSSLGGHVDACRKCGTVLVSYNSCRNRHCPKCQAIARERWLQARKSDRRSERTATCHLLSRGFHPSSWA